MDCLACLWAVTASRAFFDLEENLIKVQIAASAFEDADAIEAGNSCHSTSFITTDVAGYDGSYSWNEGKLNEYLNSQ